MSGELICSVLLRRFSLCFAVSFSAIGYAQAQSTGTQNNLSAPRHLDLAVPPQEQAKATMSPIEGALNMTSLERTFLDRFDDFQPNLGTWRHHYGHNTYESFGARTLQANKEQQVYVDPGFSGTAAGPLGINPFVLDDGVLNIIGQTVPEKDAPYLQGFEYLSGMISSEYKFEQQYGYFEARMKVPLGQGLWSAFWLKSNREHTPQGQPAWPPEIDVMEFIGRESDKYYVTVHWDVMPNNQKSGASISAIRPAENFHLYGVLWTPRQTVFYLDRQPVRAIETKANHHVPMFMILNLALGGKWPGQVNDDALPAQLNIDWVAAYQLEAAK